MLSKTYIPAKAKRIESSPEGLMHHINRNGEIAVCKATKKACPLGGAHGTREELEQVLAETYTTDSVLTKTSKKYELPESEGLPELNSLDLHYWTVVDATLGVFVHKGHPFVRSDSTKSQYYCLECNTRLPKSDEYTKVQWSVNCPNCGRECIDNLVGTTLLESSEKFFHKEAVREAVWYHYTENEEWESYLEADNAEARLMHFGTHQAAMDRKLATGNGGGRLYEIRLKPTAEIADEVLEDDPFNDDDVAPLATTAAEESRGLLVNGVTRYVNYYEDPGSVSLIAHPGSFEIVNISSPK